MVSMRPRRADARRNYDQLVTAASAAFAREGAGASLEEIARQAGVGSATLHRHFPSRLALLDAVFHDRVAALCRQAHEVAGRAEPGPALTSWLRAVGACAASTRGLAFCLLPGTLQPAPRGATPPTAAPPPAHQGATSSAAAPPPGIACHRMVEQTGDELLSRARAAGAVRPEVSISDLLTLVTAISMAVEQRPGDNQPGENGGEAERLLGLALDGIRPLPRA
jgi:AcrR family transcriptional regulator